MTGQTRARPGTDRRSTRFVVSISIHTSKHREAFYNTSNPGMDTLLSTFFIPRFVSFCWPPALAGPGEAWRDLTISNDGNRQFPHATLSLEAENTQVLVYNDIA